MVYSWEATAQFQFHTSTGVWFPHPNWAFPGAVVAPSQLSQVLQSEANKLEVGTSGLQESTKMEKKNRY